MSTNAPARIGTDSDWQAVACGFRSEGVAELRGFAMALKADGSLWGMGYNRQGQLGIGTFDDTKAPVRVGTDNDWAAVAPGHVHTMALKSDGSLWGWGVGLFGHDSVTQTNKPVKIGVDADWRAVSCGSGFTLAQKTDGTLWGWGANDSGHLENGTLNSTNEPGRIDSGSDWAE